MFMRIFAVVLCEEVSNNTELSKTAILGGTVRFLYTRLYSPETSELLVCQHSCGYKSIQLSKTSVS